MKKKEVIDKLEDWFHDLLDCTSTLNSYEIKHKMQAIAAKHERKNEWDFSWPELLMSCHNHIEKIMWQIDQYIKQLKGKKHE